MSLLLWQVIQDAKSEGYTLVDLFGTAPPSKRYSSRIGLTKFKEGFGGYGFNWLRTHDYIYNRKQFVVSNVVELIPGNIRAIGAKVMGILR